MTKAFPQIAIIAAIAGPLRTLGNEGKLVAMISDDLKRFKALTTGHTIIMGRKTYESIGRPLPNRTNFVVTRNPDFRAEGVVICSSLDEAIAKAGQGEIFIIGGGEIYAQALPQADKLYLTVIDSAVKGDAFFPDYSEFKKTVKREDRTDEKTGLKYSWVDLEK